ncbi:unnamed protein product [Moneuplotes crassus]|uniref:Uncharacterized protein n=1 Tax=Euplotes crassus TaxID=5936 RepID=A0AAD1UNY7_EUPCR|nr:unnamed protein product [Moneuplotes crassus]
MQNPLLLLILTLLLFTFPFCTAQHDHEAEIEVILEPEDPSTTQTHPSSIPNSKAKLKTPEQKQPEELDAEQDSSGLRKDTPTGGEGSRRGLLRKKGLRKGKCPRKVFRVSLRAKGGRDEEGVRSLEESKEVEVKFEKPHVDSAEYKRKMIRKGSDYVIKPRMKTIDDIIGWEYTVVFCQISFIDPHAAMLFSESFLYAVGVLFEKYNKDVVFLLVNIEEQMELFKTHGL